MPVITQSPDFDALPSTLSTAQVAKFFLRRPQTIQRWRERGYIKPIPGTGNRLWSKSEVRRRLEAVTPEEIY